MFSLAEGCNYDIPRTLSAMTEQALSPSCHLLPTPLSHVPIARLAIHQAIKRQPSSPPVDVEGVTGVNMNAESLEPAVPFVVAEGNVGLFTTGAGVHCVVVAVVHQLADSQ
jgi:hypothetical protein